MSSGTRIINIEGDLPDGIFDVRHHVLEAVPPVLYLKWAFAATCWSAPERSACLVIDDPLLRPTYGFVDYRELLSLMQRYKFSTNIAFIPWNWRRSDSGSHPAFPEKTRNITQSRCTAVRTRGQSLGATISSIFTQKQDKRLNEWIGMKLPPVLLMTG